MNWAIVLTAITWNGWLATIDAVVAVTCFSKVIAKAEKFSPSKSSSSSSSSSKLASVFSFL